MFRHNSPSRKQIEKRSRADGWPSTQCLCSLVPIKVALDERDELRNALADQAVP